MPGRKCRCESGREVVGLIGVDLCALPCCRECPVALTQSERCCTKLEDGFGAASPPLREGPCRIPGATPWALHLALGGVMGRGVPLPHAPRRPHP